MAPASSRRAGSPSRGPLAAPAPAGTSTPASPAPTAPPAQGIDILIFNKGASDDAIETVTAAAEANGYDVDDTELSEAFTVNNLKKYHTVVFLNTAGDVLNDAQQAAFETYHKAGGGFLALGSAIGTEPGWAYMNDLLGTRAATGPVSAASAPRSRSPTASTTRARRCPSTGA